MNYLQKIFLLAFLGLHLFSFSCCSQSSDSLFRPIPVGIYPYQFEIKKQDENFRAFFLLSPFRLHPSKDSSEFLVARPQILDENGYIVWYLSNPTGKMNSDFQYFPQAHLFSFMNIQKNGSVNYILMNEKFQLIDTLKNTANLSPDAHEFHILPNGHYLIGAKSYKPYNTENQVFVTEKTNKTANAVGYVIQEFDKDKKLVFQWDSNDYLSPSDFIDTYGFNAKDFDYCHGNAIAQDKNGDFLVSFRNFDAVYKISRKTGKVRWKLGGKSNQFSFANSKSFMGQHYIRILPNGNISLYDNATHAENPKISRAVEYQLDTINMTATQVWEFKEGTYGSSLGSYQRFQQKYHLINYGFTFRPSASITLANAQNEVLAHLYLKDSVLNYRAQIADIQSFIPRPKITSHKVKGGFELVAPKNCAQYLWSNGETTQKIQVKENGTYQVWVPMGVGMVGSLPFIVE
jgi:hypothetical protein